MTDSLNLNEWKLLKNSNMSYEYNCTNCGRTDYGSSGSEPMSGLNPSSDWNEK
jgi:hypothetical protein